MLSELFSEFVGAKETTEPFEKFVLGWVDIGILGPNFSFDGHNGGLLPSEALLCKLNLKTGLAFSVEFVDNDLDVAFDACKIGFDELSNKVECFELS